MSLRPAQQDIADFHRALGVATGTTPAVPAPDRKALRLSLIKEEVIDELLPALQNDNLEKIADGMADAIVVILGTALEYGIDLGPVWEEIHRTNMAKAGGPRREDGKILKPEGWQPPDICGVLARQGPLDY